MLQITRKLESVQSIKKLKLEILDILTASQRQVIRCFIESLSKLENLVINGCSEPSDILSKTVKFPLKYFFYYNTIEDDIQINCPDFMMNCNPTLESVDGPFSIETFRVLIKSLKLTELTWHSSDEIGIDDVKKFETNRSIKFENLGIARGNE